VEFEMSGLVTAVSSPFNLMIRLLDIINKYKKKKKTESRFIKAFENEIKTYINVYEQIAEISEEEIMPILESVEDSFSVHKMNELFECMSKMPLMCAELVKAFLSFAKASSEVWVIKGFMDDLKDNNIVLYDFVFTMKNAYVEENRVNLDGKYYRFFKTYEDDIFEKVEIENLDEIIGQLRRHVGKIRHYVEKTAFIKRKIRKKYAKNMRVLAKVAENITLEKTIIIDLRAYVPQKLLPIAMFLEEIS